MNWNGASFMENRVLLKILGGCLNIPCLIVIIFTGISCENVLGCVRIRIMYGKMYLVD